MSDELSTVRRGPTVPEVTNSPPQQTGFRRWLYKYGLAIVLVLAAAAIRLAFLQPLGNRAAFLTFYPAVMLSALYGGLGAGLLATVCSALLANYFWMTPTPQIFVNGSADWLAVSIFVVSGTMISWLTEAMRKAQGALKEANETLEERGAERTVKLQASERRYRSFVEVTSQFAWVTDPRGQVVEDIPAVRQFTGQTYEQAKGSGWSTALHPEDLPRTLAVWNHAVATKTPYEIEYRMRRHDGVYRLLLARSVPVCDAQGAVLEWVGTCIDITERKQAEEALRQSEEQVRRKLESVLSPQGDLGVLELADLLDAASLQKLMDDFYAVARIPMAIIDVKGRVLVGIGWQDVCTQFHRVNPETCQHCLESDTQLSGGLKPGESRLYKCKNNMWDMATPIFVAGQHLGNVFTGQFFFEDEAVDRDLFRAQARQYGFDETAYLVALDRAPRLPRVTVQRGMSFLVKLANTISQLGYSNVKLARLLAERDRLTESMRQQQILLQTVIDNCADPIFLKDCDSRILLANPATCAAMGKPAGRIIGKIDTEIYEDPAIGRQMIANDRRIMESGHTHVIEEIVPTPAGPRTFLSAKTPYRDFQGRVIGIIGVARDITERKHAEEEVRQSKDKLALALSSASMGAWRLDLTDSKRQFDDQVCRCLGIAPARFAGTAEEFFAAVHPGDHEHLKKALAQTIATGAPYEVEYRAVWPDQTIHYLAARGQLSRDAAGLPQRVDGLVWDITPRKRAEARLLQLNRALTSRNDCTQALLTAEDEPAYLEQVCRIISDNCHRAMVWLGFAEQDEGKSVRPVASAGFEEGYLQTLRVTWADTERGRGPTGTAIRTGRIDICRDMKTDPRLAPWRPEALKRGYASSLVLPLLQDGKAFGAITIYAREPDAFTEEEIESLGHLAAEAAQGILTLRLRQAHKLAEQALRESEARFRTLADSIPNLAWWANADGYITWYNQQWYAYTGTTPQQMEGWGWQSVHDPGMLPLVLKRWQASLATGQPFEMEFPLRGADGQFRWFLTRVMPLRDAAGKVVQWFGTNTDISELREAREVLARDKQQLERLVDERTAKLTEMVAELEHFSYTITHDMRAPLRAMRGFAEMVNEYCADTLAKEPREFLRRISVSADRMDNLIRDALNYNQAVRQELPLEPVDVGALLRGMLDSYPEFLPSRAHIHIQGELPVVMANEAGLTQCFSNLLNNAVKFVKPGEMPEILIRARQQDGWATIWVEDKGIGIPGSMKKRVFMMFSRGHRTYEGTGIGLALVRKVMERMGGDYGVESQEGQGSQFWLKLRLGI